MIPIFGPPPRPGIRYRRRPGAYAILLDAGRILLTEQTTDDGPDLQLPGGGIDPGEAALPALAREVLEETGHTCRVLRRVGVFRQFNWMPEYRIHAEKVCAVYLCRPGLRLGPPTEVGHRAIWMPPGAAMARLPAPGSAAILRRVLRGTG